MVKSRFRQGLLAVAVALSLVFAGCGARDGKPAAKPTAPGLTVNVIDVGQGDAILIRTAQQTVLVDTGDVPAKEKLVAFLKDQGISQLDKVFITHPHADHLGGMAQIMDSFPVKHIYDSGQTTTTAMFRNYLAMVHKKNIPFTVVSPGMLIDIGAGAALKVLGPPKPLLAGTGSDLNNNSIVMRLIYGNFSMLLAGDAEEAAESAILKQFGSEIKSNVLKSGHHGSHTSSSLPFLQAVAPEVAIISVGKNNDYHHPHPSTLKKYAERKIKVYRTDMDGTVTVNVAPEGKSYTITKERQ